MPGGTSPRRSVWNGWNSSGRRSGRLARISLYKRHRTHDAARAAGLRGLQAQQADDIARVGVVVELTRGLIVAGGLFPDVQAQIANVTEQVSFRVLRAEAAEVRPDTQIGYSGLLDSQVRSTGSPRKHRESQVRSSTADRAAIAAAPQASESEMSSAKWPRVMRQCARSSAVAASISASSTASREKVQRSGVSRMTSPVHAAGPVTAPGGIGDEGTRPPSGLTLAPALVYNGVHRHVKYLQLDASGAM